MTREEIADGALELVDVLEAEGTASAADRALCLRKLDGILAELSRLGVTWSRATSRDMNYPAGATYVLLPTQREKAGGINATRRDANGNDVPLGLYTRPLWAMVADKDATAEYPTGIYPAPDGRAYLWPVPTAAGTITLYYETLIGASEADTAPNVPDGWDLALQYGIAVEIALPFSVPLEKRLELKATWEERREMLLGADRAPVPPSIEVDD